MKRLPILLLLCSTAFGANELATDPNCVAWWRAEQNWNDSIGGNNLTKTGADDYNSTQYQEGSYSGVIRGNTERAEIADASLDAGFPGKNGASNIVFTVCFWHRADVTSDTTRYLLQKGNSTNGKCSYQIARASNDKIFMGMGHSSGTAYEGTAQSTSAMVDNNWYHIGYTFDSTSSNAWTVRVWHDDASAIWWNTSGTYSNTLNIEDGPLTLGNANGSISFGAAIIYDDVIIWDRVLTSDEIDDVRNGVYAPPSTDGGSGLEHGFSF